MKKRASMYASGIGAFVNTLEGITSFIDGTAEKVKDLAGEYAKMDDVYTDVMKYTGMTKKEVKDLNEELNKMNTRTGTEQLNALAGTAGRLGITGKSEIIEFVSA